MSALTLAVFLLGQAAPATAPGTEVRALTVTLLDEKDREVTDISAADIALAENGVSRDVTSFLVADDHPDSQQHQEQPTSSGRNLCPTILPPRRSLWPRGPLGH